MQRLFLAIGLLLSFCPLGAMDMGGAEPNPQGFTGPLTIRFDTLQADTVAEVTAAKVNAGSVPCMALEFQNQILRIYSFGLPETFFVGVRKGNSDEALSSDINIFKDQFQSVIAKDSCYHGKNLQLLPDKETYLVSNQGFDVYTTFLDGHFPVTVQAHDANLLSQFFSFKMYPFAPGAYGAFLPGGSFFSGHTNFSKPSYLRPNLLVDDSLRFVIAAQQLNIQIKAPL